MKGIFEGQKVKEYLPVALALKHCRQRQPRSIPGAREGLA
jgi:hypothetical protein